LNISNNFSQKIENLGVGSYSITIRVDGISNYERKYEIKIGEPPALNAITSVDSLTGSLKISLKGAENYFINLNGAKTETIDSRINLPLQKGLNTLRITTSKDCQGAYNEEIFLSEEINIFPNPTSGPVKIFIPGNDSEVEIKINSMTGVTSYQTMQNISMDRILDLDLSQFTVGVYLVKMSGSTVRSTCKLIKF
jgi:hypothetical protein